MVLIDRDKLYNDICKPSDLPDDSINVCDIRLAIINQPAIEAIPIEWLRMWFTKKASLIGITLISEIESDWEKENETVE